MGPIYVQLDQRRTAIVPIYEYICSKCGDEFEVIQGFSDKPLKTCKKCKGRLRKKVSQSSFHLKGSGWYVTDYAGSAKPGNTPGNSNGNNGSNSGKSESSPKPESKSKSESKPKSDSKPKSNNRKTVEKKPSHSSSVSA